MELAWRMQPGNLCSRTVGWLKKEIFLLLGSEWIINRKLKQGPYNKSHGLDIKKLKQNPHGIDLGPMQPCLPGRLFTVDKKINLAPDECLADIPGMNSALLVGTASSVANDYDLLLIGRRDPRTNNSWLHNSYRMVKGKKRCLAFIHPQDAESRGIADGEDVTVRSRVGSIKIPVALTDEIMPGVISIPHGWGHDMEGANLSVARDHAGVNTNILTDENFLDSLSGNAALNGVPVSLNKNPMREQA